MKIRVRNLRLRTIVGIYDWEKAEKQDVIINIEFEIDGTKAALSDSISDTLNYKNLNKKIIDTVQSSEFNLLEKLAKTVLDIVMQEEKVLWARVEVDKPGALRFSDSVSVECESAKKS